MPVQEMTVCHSHVASVSTDVAETINTLSAFNIRTLIGIGPGAKPPPPAPKRFAATPPRAPANSRPTASPVMGGMRRQPCTALLTRGLSVKKAHSAALSQDAKTSHPVLEKSGAGLYPVGGVGLAHLVEDRLLYFVVGGRLLPRAEELSLSRVLSDEEQAPRAGVAVQKPQLPSREIGRPRKT